MRINGSQLHSVAFHTQMARTERQESLRQWTGARRPNFEGLGGPESRPRIDTSSLSREARSAHEASKASGPEKSGEDSDAIADPKLRLLVALIERMTGKKMHLFNLDPHEIEVATVEAHAAGEAVAQAAAPAQRAGWGVEYELHERYVEAEQTTFSAEGVVSTADGKEVRFKVELSMSRQFVQENHVSLRLGDAVVKDPIVLNFDGNAAELSDMTFDFDIDSDGTVETLHALKPGSAFLFIDTNGDGRATNGTELFGAKTGNGFAELRVLDDDGDGWIDEDDAAFHFLKLWSQDGEGEGGEVTGLAEAGVGAINLDGVETPFAVKDASNRLLGQVRATSVYLAENGGVGTVQQIDLAG